MTRSRIEFLLVQTGHAPLSCPGPSSPSLLVLQKFFYLHGDEGANRTAAAGGLSRCVLSLLIFIDVKMTGRGRGRRDALAIAVQTQSGQEEAEELVNGAAGGRGTEAEGREPTLSDLAAILRTHMGQQQARDEEQRELAEKQERRFKALQQQFQVLQTELQARTTPTPDPPPAVIHSLKYFQTGSSGVSNFPEFVHVVMLDEVQIYYYDSNSQKLEVKQSWMDLFTRDEPDALERGTRYLQRKQQDFKAGIKNLKKRFNQIGVLGRPKDVRRPRWPVHPWR
ncbi:Major histocompatibility complex class I-related gene protein [Merluccius polli]|uniref:Major histocompatibility complex class I-related gene protein n=1 Tax=Merluccius polli TaxID=89951 RepID=A0AA47MYA5_MERPO|nr:Major histocompatibility complex class I-related gene protein [Merluccius polli]